MGGREGGREGRAMEWRRGGRRDGDITKLIERQCTYIKPFNPDGSEWPDHSEHSEDTNSLGHSRSIIPIRYTAEITRKHK